MPSLNFHSSFVEEAFADHDSDTDEGYAMEEPQITWEDLTNRF